MELSGNPSLRWVIRGSRKGKYTAVDSNVASMGSMVWKSVLFCAVATVAAVVSAILLYNFLVAGNVEGLAILLVLLAVSAIPMFIISIVIMFAPATAGVLGFIYCLLEGMVMGVVSALIDLVFPGVSIMAFLGTCLVLIVSCVVFRLLGQRLPNKFVKFVLISFVSLVLLEAIGFILSMFVPLIALIMNNILVQLAISEVMILWAAFMIMVDLNNMQLLVDYGTDKKYEWLAAFSLVTTLIWLYFEILELLVKLFALAKN